MKVAIYLRKSRADEYKEEVAVTLARHKNILLNLAEKNQYTVLDVYEEVVSGESLYARPQMLELLNHVENKKYEAVLCMDIDRLGRGGMRDQGVILDTFRLSDTNIITPDRIYDLSNEIDEELTEFKSFLSRREYKLITKRLQRGIQSTIQDGGYVSNAPYGYQKTKIGRLPSLSIVEEEAYFVHMIFDRYLSGMGCESIAREITGLGAKPRRGDSFSRTTVRKILSNPTYTGKIIWRQKQSVRSGIKGEVYKIIYNQPDQWVVIEGKHPAIVSEEQFAEVQKILQERRIPPRHIGGKTVNPLAGILVCGNCGRKMQMQVCRQRFTYIRCPNRDNTSIDVKVLEKAIISQFKNKLSNLPVQWDHTQKDDKSILHASLEKIKKEKSNTKVQLNRLCDLLEQGIYDNSIYQERSILLQSRLEDLRQKETAIDRQIKNDTDFHPDHLETVWQFYNAADAKTRNILLKAIITEVQYVRNAPGEDFYLMINSKDF